MFWLATLIGKVSYLLFLSFNRMLIAYIISAVLAAILGYVLYKHKYLELLLFPIIDVLQSVPILVFFPVALLFIIDILPEAIGPEVAVIFLIVTSMIWNLIFSIYEGLLSIPQWIKDLGKLMRIDKYTYLTRIFIPKVIPSFISNSMVSWANGWYFLIATEIIALGKRKYELEGIGSFLMKEAHKGNLISVLVGLTILSILIVGMNIFIWKPLLAWATTPVRGERRKTIYERIGGAFSPIGRVFDYIGNLMSKLTSMVSVPIKRLMNSSMGEKVIDIVDNIIGVTFLGISLLFIFGFAYATITSITDMPKEATKIPVYFINSFIRIIIAYVLSVLWTYPAAIYIGTHKKIERILISIFEVIASIPVTALFPIIVYLIITWIGNIEVAAIIFLMTTMQWYIFFPIYGAIENIPKYVYDIKRLFKIKNPTFLIKCLIPPTLSQFFVGSLAAIGGGWNAVIVAEYIIFEGKRYIAPGIGSLMSKALYEMGDAKLLFLAALSVGIVVPLLNIFVWKPLIKWSSKIGSMEETS